MHVAHRTRVALIGVCAVLVALIATALAVGGSGPKRESAGMPSSTSASVGVGAPALVPDAAHVPVTNQAQVSAGLPEPAVAAAPTVAGNALPRPVATGGTVATGSGSASFAADRSIARGAASVAATRIVKTADLQIRAPKASVQTVADKLNLLATAEGGYVSQSNTELGSGAPSSEVVLRIPVARFQDAISQAEKLGTHVISVSVSADDVTGKYVDLSARKHALEQTRSTYLSILSRARTIGATLAVQQRIDDVQQQIDQLAGQLKLLGNQSSYSTLTVDVVPSGVVTPAHHAAKRHGIGAAWHRSWSRFSRGVDAMVGAIGPIVFVLLLLALIGLVGWFGNRSVRRLVGEHRSAV